MAHTFSRRELYDLVWSEPMRTIASRLGLSDVGVAKACRHANIPVPPRGYWNRKQAGYQVGRLPLPKRDPGRSDNVKFGQDRSWYYQSAPVDESEPEPLAPTFDELIESVRGRVEKRTGAVRATQTFDLAHPAVRALLERDERRREKQRTSPYAGSWEAPVFDTPLQKRRLRILNTIFLALAKQGYTASIRGDKADEITVSIGQSHISLELAARPDKGRSPGRDTTQRKHERLRLSVKAQRNETISTVLAADLPHKALESGLSAIVVELIVLGEERYREDLIQVHKWELERRQRLIEEAKRQKAEAERKGKERQAAVEKARVDHLLGEALSLHKARAIRVYVEAVRAASALDPTVPDVKLSTWTQWALAQADRIDPIASRRFLAHPELMSPPNQPERHLKKGAPPRNCTKLRLGREAN